MSAQEESQSLVHAIWEHLLPSWALDDVKVETQPRRREVRITIVVTPLAGEAFGADVCVRWQNLVSRTVAPHLHDDVKLIVLVVFNDQAVAG